MTILRDAVIVAIAVLAFASIIYGVTGLTNAPVVRPVSNHAPGWGTPTAPPQLRLAPAPNTTATMYDSITLSTIPPNPFALAGYTSGFWPTYLPMRHRWPNAHTVSIAVTSRNHADCLDVEPGDARPDQVPSWVRADRQAGFARPCIYSSWWMFVHEIRPVLQHAGISRNSVWEWSADYTFRPHLDAGFDATQWTDRAYGRNLDQSVVTRAFLSIAQPPLQPPQPKPIDWKKIAYLRSLARKHNCYRHGSKPWACHVWALEVRHFEGR